MRLRTAIECLFDNYVYALDKEWIRDKVAWALYQTWKEAEDHKDEPQKWWVIDNLDDVLYMGLSHREDGYMTAEQTEDYRKMLDKAEHNIYGNIEDELQQCYLQTSCDHYGDKQVCGRCREYNLYSHTNTEPQTDCSWMKGADDA